ncbi:hypothetical protein COCCADRAFT_100812 [Bipolaris zeicola 26-R-13]|uniref:Uncharacterized protein n=1 Tax=Cochliobolus carbonum (strain 26-R-13) TaxID=930089 RepID=W6Y8D7_COCC2|nr:uncharacterized protein COCCADRAFT_100812 [Bipolaris zeicola 26-R-13]EUC31629.1 hypothetical protein COCCADRAFT_100812 [Bipolaris zeicola 26-R-13]
MYILISKPSCRGGLRGERETVSLLVICNSGTRIESSGQRTEGWIRLVWSCYINVHQAIPRDLGNKCRCEASKSAVACVELPSGGAQSKTRREKRRERPELTMTMVENYGPTWSRCCVGVLQKGQV